MATMLPVAVYGLKVPAGDLMVPATRDFPATFRITMAALDPSAKSESSGGEDDGAPARATLKMIYDSSRPEDNESEDWDEEMKYLRALRDGDESDGLSDEDEDEESFDEEEKNGGPSDPSKSTKARKEAAAKSIMAALAGKLGEEENEDDVDVDGALKVNGITESSKAEKGKGKAEAGDSNEDEDIDGESAMKGLEQVVICTLDPIRTYQQPIDITIPEDQPTYFKVSGTHAIYLTGNYVLPPNDDFQDQGENEEDYDLSPDEDEVGFSEDEDDELDDVEDPRITEIDTDDENEVPELVVHEAKKQQHAKKGKNKRPAEDSNGDAKAGTTLDDIMSKSLKPEDPATNGEPKLSKRQRKKLKSNAGKAVEATADAQKEDPAEKSDKKVQFAINLEQGPSSSPSTLKAETNGETTAQPKKQEEKPKASLGPKMVQGVKIDDKKLGRGPAAKKGDTLGMRYIGKLSDGKVFDANKKGPPFKFELGSGQTIKGWDIGLAGMSVNGERRIVVPASLGYGSKKQGVIPANSELTFDVKLLEIN